MLFLTPVWKPGWINVYKNSKYLVDWKVAEAKLCRFGNIYKVHIFIAFYFHTLVISHIRKISHISIIVSPKQLNLHYQYYISKTIKVSYNDGINKMSYIKHQY